MNKEDFYFGDQKREQLEEPASRYVPPQQNKFSDIFVYCLIGCTTILIVVVLYLLFSGSKPQQAVQSPRGMQQKPPQKPPLTPKQMPDIKQDEAINNDSEISQLKDSWSKSRMRNKNKFKVKKDLEDQQESTEYIEEESSVQSTARFEEEE